MKNMGHLYTAIFDSYRRVPDVRFVIVNLDRYHTTNRPAACANEIRPFQLAVLLVVW